MKSHPRDFKYSSFYCAGAASAGFGGSSFFSSAGAGAATGDAERDLEPERLREPLLEREREPERELERVLEPEREREPDLPLDPERELAPPGAAAFGAPGAAGVASGFGQSRAKWPGWLHL